MSFYPFSEGAGTTTADEVGDHDATLVGGPQWTTGHDGPGLQFNGSDQFADTGAAILDTEGSYSVSAWVKLDRLGSFATAVSQDGPSNSAFFLQYSGADNRFAFSFAGVRALAPAAPQTGQWYHLTGVRDAASGALTLYVNGQKAAPPGVPRDRLHRPHRDRTGQVRRQPRRLLARRGRLGAPVRPGAVGRGGGEARRGGE